ncbi:glycosyl hydrolase [Catenovulum sp. 2E275]|uniref:glycosyl hydrolase n=1 Tax=Catenovulum sp. 2E275 TaxID=2980497 RepID=UPI0021D277FF|nr:glycosyl hydrolase [Catenovulum sp. 2E275]MCU4675953.1 glycosyl hydrolase [Catenovulum sp. 2E275]
MATPFIKKPIVTLMSAVLMAGMTTACVDEGTLNTDKVTYTPEERSLGALAGEDVEKKPGEEVSIPGRILGTTTNESKVWVQISGDPIEIADPTADNLTFTAPDVSGSVAFEFELRILDENGEQALDEDGNPIVDTVKITVFDPDSVTTLEAEDAQLTGGLEIAVEGDSTGHYIAGASGDAHTNDVVPGQEVIWNLDIATDKAGYYTLFVNYAIGAGYGDKGAQVSVNGLKTDISFQETGGWTKARIGVFNLDAGINEIIVGGGWNYYRVDNIELIPAAAPPKPLAVPTELVNDNATAAASDLMAFLVSNYGSATLSGQAEYPTNDGSKNELTEFNKIKAATGDDLPAIVEFDLMEYSSNRIANGSNPGSLSEDAIAAHNQENVIISLAWHWNAPMHITGDWSKGFYTEETDFDLAAAIAAPNSAEYAALIADIDDIAAELAKFAEQDIPVLWRPIHEAEGTWFWWGAQGSDAFKALWQLMYERLTTTHGLNNLIWVYTGAGDLSEDWYPGNDVVDIVGYDGYDGVNDANAFQQQYSKLKNRFNGKKMVALTETGAVPNVEMMHSVDAWWAYFVTWYSRDWNEYGPGNMQAETIDTNYAYQGVVNLAAVPGGDRLGAGVYKDFEYGVQNWGAQVNWGDTTGIYVSDAWGADGAHSLVIEKDLKAEFEGAAKLENVVMQTYPETAIDVTDKKAMNIYVKSVGAGDAVTAHIFWKGTTAAGDAAEHWPWPPTAVTNDTATMLTLPVNADADGNPIELASISGLGVRFEGLDNTQTNAQFYIDKVELVAADDSVTNLYNFEPSTGDWHGQVNWGTTTGTTLSSEFANTGAQSFAMYKDLSAYASVDNMVLQAYPEGGINATDYTSLKITTYNQNVGDAVNAHIFWKATDTGGSAQEYWPASVNTAANSATELTIDLTQNGTDPVELETINGLGVRFQGLDATSTQAMVAIDTIKLVKADNTESVIYDFEGTSGWDFQVNWANRGTARLATDWAAEGKRSLAGKVQLTADDLAVEYPSVVLQTYPEGGIKLGDVSTLKLTVFANNAGDNVTAKLFAKDPSGAWFDAGSVAITENGTELEIDLAQIGSDLGGFGVQFEGLTNSDSESSFYIDNVRFE